MKDLFVLVILIAMAVFWNNPEVLGKWMADVCKAYNVEMSK